MKRSRAGNIPVPIAVLVAVLCLTGLSRGGFSVTVNGEPVDGPVAFLSAGIDTLVIDAGEASLAAWCLLEPVRAAYDEITPTHSPGVESVAYTASGLSPSISLTIIAGVTPGFPEAGTFYITEGMFLPMGQDTIHSAEPLHLDSPDILQVVVREDDTYIGYLMELINTPFIMCPRSTPAGNHHADDRMGSDCAGFATYARRRQGYSVEYLGPRGITAYLIPVVEGAYGPVEEGDLHLYLSSSGDPLTVGGEGLHPGDILHFGAQVSVFYMDRGYPGVLDSEDLLLQSWFDGPHICTVRENGFFGLPVRAFMWADEPGA